MFWPMLSWERGDGSGLCRALLAATWIVAVGQRTTKRLKTYKKETNIILCFVFCDRPHLTVAVGHFPFNMMGSSK